MKRIAAVVLCRRQSRSARSNPSATSAAALTFRYSYAVERGINAPTEIELPPYTYPHGYTTRVNGARIVSSRHATVLELLADRHAVQVRLTVRAVGRPRRRTYNVRPGATTRRGGPI